QECRTGAGEGQPRAQPGDLPPDHSALPALPVSPASCSALKTSVGLKSPVTWKDVASFAAVVAFTPGTLVSASFTAVTHFLQQRWTPSTASDVTFASLAPLVASTLIDGSLAVPK